MFLFTTADYSEWEIVLIFFKYFLIAGGLYLVYYRFFLNRFIAKKLQPQIPERKQVLSEIKYSLSTLMIYAIAGAGIWLAKQNGYTLIYNDWKEYGVFYFFASFPLMVFMNDTYFYWVHRFLHLPAIFPVAHKVHHRYKSPSPWAAFAFHPLEAILETLILPLIVFTIPAHPFIIFLFILHMFVINILGHLGFETYPKWFFKNKICRWINTTTYHDKHHQVFNANYGLYTTFWDRIMRTLKQ